MEMFMGKRRFQVWLKVLLIHMISRGLILQLIRIPRVYADYRRVYARRKIGYGNEIAAVLQCNKDWQPCVLLWGYELAYRCKRSIGHFLRRLK